MSGLLCLDRPFGRRPSMAVRRRSESAPAWHFPKTRRFFYYSPQKLKDLEKGFQLDGVPLSKLANDEIGRTHPSLNLGIHQYTATEDPHCQLYYSRRSFTKENSMKAENWNTLANVSMMGTVNDMLLRNSAANLYMKDRQQIGAGYTRKLYGGHGSVPVNKPFPGYNGEDGYRRNTPELRAKPSPFDCEDPFEWAKPCFMKGRAVMSAPGNIHKFRKKSAKLYGQGPMIVTKKATTSTIGFTQA